MPSSFKDITPRPEEVVVFRDAMTDRVLVRAPGIQVALPLKALAECGPSGVQADWDQFVRGLYTLLSSFHLGDTARTLADTYASVPPDEEE